MPITSSGVISDLSYTLTPGMTYNIYGQIFLFINATTNEAVEVEVKDGATIIGRAASELDVTSGLRKLASIYGISITRTMQNSSLTFNLVSGDTDSYVRGNGTFSQTYATVVNATNFHEGTIS